MTRMTPGATEIARVSMKIKKPIWKKTILILMSDGSTWERTILKSPEGKKIKSEWTKINQARVGKHTRETFLRIFLEEGWKQKPVKTYA